MLIVIPCHRTYAAGKTPQAVWGPDRFGGYASTHIIVQLEPELARNVLHEAQRANANQKTAATNPRALQKFISADLHATMNRWGVTGIRPLYPYAFKHPNLATKYKLDRTFIIELPWGTDTPKAATAFTVHHDEIEAAGVDGIGYVAQLFPDDSVFSSQWNLHNTGQTGGMNDADVNAPEAWEIHTGLDTNITIAIVDSGVDSDPYNGVTPHPEFVGRMVPGINTVITEPDDATGDECFHGTHVAGIASATGNNAIGVAGMHWGTGIMPVDVLGAGGDPCSGSITDMVNGIIWATDHDADVINISLQFYNLSSTSLNILTGAVNTAHDMGIVIVGAAGNNVPNVIAFPARLANCMAVSATNHSDELDFISNWGTELDVAAPGRNIWSTWPNGSYVLISGTSMATPHVSGLAALLKTTNPMLSNTEIRNIITSSADDLGDPGWDNKFGYGRINAQLALEMTQTELIPTVSSWGIVVMFLFIIIAGTFLLGRTRRTKA